MALRSDGRYLFYNSANAFNLIDLNDMARVGTATQTDGTVMGVFLDGDSRLIVATTVGAQYYGITEPYAPVAETTKFTITSSTNTVVDTCVDSAKNVYFLESGSGPSTHQVRVAQGGSQTGFLLLSNLFTAIQTTVQPLAIRCADTRAIIFATTTAASRESALYAAIITGVTGGAQDFNLTNGIENDYAVKDFILSDKKDQIVVLYNKKTPANNFHDSRIRVFNASNLARIGSGNENDIGSLGRALASYVKTDTSDAYFYGIFMGKDFLKNSSDPPLNQFLLASAPIASLPGDPSSSASIFQTDRGAGITGAGVVYPSKWVSSKQDHYKYGLTETSGVTLLSDAPQLLFTTSPAGQVLTSTAALQFSITPSVNVDYDIRFDDQEPEKGVTTGINRNVGTSIKTGSMTGGAPNAFTLSKTDLGIKTSGTRSIYIFARDNSLGAGNYARLGFRFDYFPPPGAVQDFHLGIGDQGVYVHFDSPGGTTLDSFKIYFSYDPADLAVLDGTNRNVATGVNGGVLTSPIVVKASDWDGTYAMGPFQNGRALYVRVQVTDTRGQLSENDPEALSATPRRTLTVPEALGAANSCTISASIDAFGSVLLLTFLFLLGVFALRKRVSG